MKSFPFSISAVLVSILLISSAIISGCRDEASLKADQSFYNDTLATERSVANIQASQPVPDFKYSQERYQLIERQKRLNNPNKISYIALIDKGLVISTFTIKGKVSSLNSLATNPSKVVVARTASVVVPSPDIDTSYGSNPEGIFFFTVDGTMVEWSGTYLWKDTPFVLTTPPVLVQAYKK